MKAVSSVALLAWLCLEWLSRSVQGNAIFCSDPDMCNINSAAADRDKRQFYRFGRDFSGDDFDDVLEDRLKSPWIHLTYPSSADRDKRQFYRFGRGYNYADELADRFKKEFLRFGRSAPLEADGYFLQPGDELYRTRRSVTAQEASGHSRSKRSAEQGEQSAVKTEAAEQNKELEKREADPSELEEQKRFMRFGRGDAEAEKRFMRFGKRFMRFGRGLAEEAQPWEVDKRFMRFGRLPEVDKSFVRFGKRSGDGLDDEDGLYNDLEDDDSELYRQLVELGKRFMRFGKREDGAEKRFMRFGKSGEAKRFMRFGKSSPEAEAEAIDNEKRFMRFGKRFMRFGRDGEDKRFMRFGKREARSADQTEAKEAAAQTV